VVVIKERPLKEKFRKDDFIQLYETLSQRELCEYYNCSFRTIRRCIKEYHLQPRPRGGGNNRKYNLEKSQLELMLKQGMSRKDMQKILDIKKSTLERWLKKFNLRKDIKVTEFQKFARKVRRLTRETYDSNRHVLNPENLPRTLCGVEGGYQLDHKISIRESFDMGHSVYDCSQLENLQIISWQENLQKRKFNKMENEND